MNSIKQLNITSNHIGLAQLTPSFGGSIAEANAVCMQASGHSSGVEMIVGGAVKDRFAINWQDPDKRAASTWADMQVAAEHGAYAVAICVIAESKGLNALSRSRKGTGFDFWLGELDSDLPFQDKARLEVSGILKGTDSQVEYRAKKKKEQMAPTNGNLVGYAFVVEFGAPQSKVIQT
jgi:hypothetical protein